MRRLLTHISGDGVMNARRHARLAAEAGSDTDQGNSVGNWSGGWLNGEWKCPECKTTIGRNLRGEGPHALVRQHRCPPAARHARRIIASTRRRR